MRQLDQSVGRIRCYMSGFLVKTHRYEEKLHTLHFWEKGRLRKTGAKALVRQTREMLYEITFKEALSLYALRVIYPVIV